MKKKKSNPVLMAIGSGKSHDGTAWKTKARAAVLPTADQEKKKKNSQPQESNQPSAEKHL
jgi:hypothetical protein